MQKRVLGFWEDGVAGEEGAKITQAGTAVFSAANPFLLLLFSFTS